MNSNPDNHLQPIGQAATAGWSEEKSITAPWSTVDQPTDQQMDKTFLGGGLGYVLNVLINQAQFLLCWRRSESSNQVTRW